MIDRNRIVLQDIAQQLTALAVNIARIEHVELLRHSKDLAKAVVAPHDLALVGLLVLNGIVVEPRKERVAVSQQLAFGAFGFHRLGVAQLYVAAHGAHHKVRNKRQPVGRLVEETLEGIAVLDKEARRQTRRSQQRRDQTKIEPIECADQHYVEQAIIEHIELRRLGKHQLKTLKEHPSERGLQAFDEQLARPHAIDDGTQRVGLLGAGIGPASLNSREIAQQVIALEPAVAHTDSIAGGQRIASRLTIGDLKAREQVLQRVAQTAHRVVKTVGHIDDLKGIVPAVEDAAHQNGKFLRAKQGQRRVRCTLQSDRTARARLKERHQKRVDQRR